MEETLHSARLLLATVRSVGDSQMRPRQGRTHTPALSRHWSLFSWQER